MKTKKRILFFWLWVTAFVGTASACFPDTPLKPYPFSYEESEGWHACDMDIYQKAGNWDKNKVVCKLEIFLKPGVITQMGFELVQFDTIPANHVLDLSRLARAKPDRNLAVVDITIYLANGEILTSPYLFLSDYRNEGNKTTSYGAINALFDASSFSTSLTDLSGLTKSQKSWYITSTLAKHNIRKLVIAGYSFEFENFNSGPTYHAMLLRLATETGVSPYTQCPIPLPQ